MIGIGERAGAQQRPVLQAVAIARAAAPARAGIDRRPPQIRFVHWREFE